ncbi:MAG: hypothetical protein V4584_02265 [Verrucomicrobiota bacterium]
MKRSTLLILALGTAVTAFSLARWSRPAAVSSTHAAAPPARPALARVSPVRDTTPPPAKEIGKYPPACKGVTTEQALQLTSQERMAMLARGALVSDWGNQAALLCGLISGLTSDELAEATKILTDARQLGNGQPAVVWQSLWQQWGRLDPQAAFARFAETEGDETNDCARNLMQGWLETRADGALAWAQTPKNTRLEAVAAALAISRDANGDPKQLAAALLKLPADGATAQAGLDDYFDLASLTPDSPSPAEIYAQLDPSLRPAAWSVAAKRLTLGDPALVKSWLTTHAADPGRDYQSTARFISSQAYQDPAATARWAAQLPYDAARDSVHPAARAFLMWRQSDPAAAEAWLKTQPADAPWIPRASAD